MKITNITKLILVFLLAVSCKHVPPPESVGPLPSSSQLAWHELEYYAFIHFNINTFTGKSWGHGDEDPKLFNPSELDCRQWARVCKEAGMKGIIITAKHHDGFCIWPSEFTQHSVKNSTWRNGKGDILKELREACDEYGLKLGMYYSPWDRNHADYGKPEYLVYMRNQLKELMTNYGDIFEVWFDGANGGTGYYGGANEKRNVDRKTYYDWENTYKIVRELQPNTLMFSDAGPEVRWCGNEEGWIGKTNWSILRRDEVWPGWPRYVELRNGHEDGTHWVPAEVDVSIRPGWYYREGEDHKVKTIPQLLDIYYHSVGRGGTLLLNFPVDQRGLIHENDAAQSLKLGKMIKADFENNLATKTEVNATNTRGESRDFDPKNVLDDNKETYWTTNDDVSTASLTIDLKKPTSINRFMVQEYIKLGQRVQEFTIDAFVNNNWEEIASETTIGYKRILRFETVTATKVRMNIKKSKASPVISNIGIYNAPKILVEPKISRNQEGFVSLTAFDKGIEIYFTTDGKTPTKLASKYKEPFLLLKKGIVKAIIIDPETGNKSPLSTIAFDIPSKNWKVVRGYANDKNVGNIFDGNDNSSWKTAQKSPTEIIIDLGEQLTINGFTYLPGQEKRSPGVIFDYEFFISKNGRLWNKPVKKGEFSNIHNNPILQRVSFLEKKGRYVKLRAISTAENAPVGIAEFTVTTKSE